jgi:hypothetical protein
VSEKELKNSIPYWLTIVIIIEALPMFIGPVIAISSPSLIPGFGDVTAPTGPMYLYAIRNLAVGAALLIAFLLKDSSMLFILILVRLITDLLDLPTGLFFDAFPNSLRATLLFVLLYYIPALFALRYLWKQMRMREEPVSS